MRKAEKPTVNRKARWMKVGVALIPLVIGFTLISSMLDDDAYITFWSAHILAETGEIVNYNGDRVEQSSSLAFVILLAVLAKLVPITLPTMGPLVSSAFGGGTVLLTQRLMSKLNPALSVYAGLLTGSATCLIAWSVSGMETTFQAFLGVWLLLAYARFMRSDLSAPVGLSACMATVLYIMVRPESVFVVLSVLLGMTALLCVRLKTAGNEKRKQTLTAMRRTGLLLLHTILTAVALGAFRQFYFGDWFPQPVAAKVAGISMSKAVVGFKYMLNNAWTSYDSAIWVLALLGIGLNLLKSIKEARLCPVRIIVMLFTASYTAFIVLSGGDWMAGGRFLVPLLPATVIIALDILQLIKPQILMKVLIGVLVCIQIFAASLFARNESWGGPMWATEHVDSILLRDNTSWFEAMQRHAYHDIIMTSRLADVIQRVRLRKTGRISIMSGQMGQVAYYTTISNYSHVQMIDRWALVTRDFTDCPVTASNPKFSVGLVVGYDFFFKHIQELKEICGLEKPDIIWDWGGENFSTKSFVETNGYSVVYWQDGFVTNGSQWFPGHPARAREFIAVRGDILGPDSHIISYNFSNNQS